MGIIERKKEYNYFRSFSDVAEIAKTSAEFLDASLREFDLMKIDFYAKTMHEYENRADAKKHELCSRLAHEFMPPIAREDLSQLAQELDNVVDQIENVMRRMFMFHIASIRREALDFSRLAVDACEALSALLKEFPNFKKSKTIQNYIIEINTIENKGDQLHAASIRNMYSHVMPSAEQIAWTMIFEAMENSIDACENAADVIDDIIMKNT